MKGLSYIVTIIINYRDNRKMFELSRKKRMQIEEQITDKRTSRTSAERRQVVEKEYDQFVRTMKDLKPPVSQSSLQLSAGS